MEDRQKEDVAIKRRFIRWMEDNRGLILTVIGLPASFIFDLIMRTRNWLHATFFSSPRKHGERVRKIQAQVRQWNNIPEGNERPFMCTARPNWLSLSTTFFNKEACHKVPVPLYDILELNEEKMTVRVEPMVSVGDITRYLIPKGYTLAVTLEIADATLGGLAMGVGMTTYSHKVGLYQECIEAYDVVLGDGSLIRASREDHSDLYHCLPWSHGTLGFLVALELKIIKVKPYVHMKYIPVKGKAQYCQMIRDLSGAYNKEAQVPDYIEATVYNKEEAVIMVGNFANVETNEQKAKINRVATWHKPWFYKHVETFLNGNQEVEEFIPLRDYLLRHDKAIFWVLESMIPFGNHPLFLLLLGWMLPPKPAFMKLTTTPTVRALTFTKQVFQDIVLPINKLEDQIDVSERLFNTYPILIYPCRVYDHGSLSGQLRPPRPDQMCPGTNWGMFNDLGVYGVPQKVKEKQRYDAVGAMRAMEKFTQEVGGYPFLYADTFMTRPEFEKMFDLTNYEKVREKYYANGAFPHLYDKIKPEIDVIEVGKAYMDPL